MARKSSRAVGVALLAIMFGLGCSTSGGGHAPRYDLAEIGVTVDRSAFQTFCVDAAPAPARGFIASSESVECNELRGSERSPKVKFWAEYNVVDDLDGLEELASRFCGESSEHSGAALLGFKARQCCTLDSKRCLLVSQGLGEVSERLNYFLEISAASASKQQDLARVAAGALRTLRSE